MLNYRYIPKCSVFCLIGYLILTSMSCDDPIIPPDPPTSTKPMWPQYGYDGRMSGNLKAKNVNIPPVNNTSVLWSDTLDSGVFFTVPTIDSEGNIYYLHSIPPYTNDILYKYDKNGNVIWTYDSLSSNNSAGIALSEDEKHVYFSIFSGLYCLDSSGNLQWRIPESFSQNSKPAIGSDGTIYACLGQASQLYAVSKDGAIKWTVPNVLGSVSIDVDNNIYGNYYDGSFKVCKILSGGTLDWTHPLTPSNQGSLGLVIDANNNIYFGSGGLSGLGNFTSLNKEGLVRWQKISGEDSLLFYGSVPAISSQNIVYTVVYNIRTGDGVAAYDTLGNFIWKNGDLSSNFSFSYLCLDTEGNIYGCTYGSMSSYAPDGTMRWSYNLGNPHFSLSPYQGIFTGSDNGKRTILYFLN